MSVDGSGDMERPSRSRSAAARVLGAGARGAERLAGATGLDQAIEEAAEEAIVRALRSPAVERAIVRVIVEQNAVQSALERALTSEEVAAAIMRALESEAADRIWAEILAGPKAQMLVERVAEAPEVRAAIAQQGVGLVTDVGRRLTSVTEAIDDAIEEAIHRVLHKPGHEAETNQVGLVTRAVAAALDLALIGVALSFLYGQLASLIPAATEGGDGLSLVAVLALGALGFVIGGSVLVAFWALVGQTPGMRLLSIHIEVDGSPELGLRRALMRLLGVILALLPAGLGFLAIPLSGTRRGWHDRLAGTTVVYDDKVKAAPWSRPEGTRELPPGLP